MINALRRSKVEHYVQILSPPILEGDQRLTAIKGRTLLWQSFLPLQDLVINALRRSKVEHKTACLDALRILMSDQRLTAIKGRTL